MKFSEKWLREIVNPKVDSEELSYQLTMAGLEVDGITKACEKFDGLFISEVISIKKHPNADKLHICEVDCGEKELLTIVCGASNVKQGMHTVLAKVGAQLPNKPKLKSVQLKGVESHGMLCSASEIGLSDESAGIIELSSLDPIGKSLNEIIGDDDNIIDISLTPNRGDCLSIYGIAREVAAINKIDFNNHEMNIAEITTSTVRQVKLSAKTECPRYICRVIENVDLDIKTPLWMSEKLRCSGIQNINIIIDIANFVMLELGQPLHIFDNDKLKNTIEVRFPKGKEKLKLLDETDIAINAETLLIADESGALAIAGLMGGFDSAVSNQTKNILIESAFFKPEIIRGKARKFSIQTDASLRFERGVDYDLQATAIERASCLIQEVVGGRFGRVQEFKNKSNMPREKNISLSISTTNKVLGSSLTKSLITTTLKSLGLKKIDLD